MNVSSFPTEGEVLSLFFLLSSFRSPFIGACFYHLSHITLKHDRMNCAPFYLPPLRVLPQLSLRSPGLRESWEAWDRVILYFNVWGLTTDVPENSKRRIKHLKRKITKAVAREQGDETRKLKVVGQAGETQSEVKKGDELQPRPCLPPTL